jgi:hypothetical protein
MTVMSLYRFRRMLNTTYPFDVVGVAKHEPNFRKIVPSDAFDYSNPCLDFSRGIWILLHGLPQMLARHNVH